MDDSAPAPAQARAVPWHSMSVDDALDALDADADEGLSTSAASARLTKYGRNEIAEGRSEPAWKIFLAQYNDFMQLLLLGAAIVSLFIPQISTAILLFVLTLVNATLGYRQEAKAEKSVDALREMMEDQTRVVRGGTVAKVDAETLVPGDIVLIEAGDSVPADGRLIRAARIEIEESALTGESLPVDKATDTVDDPEAPLGDRFDMVYMNTLVTRGSATFVVTATGMQTEIGRIAEMIGAVKSEKSPLQRQMDGLAKAFAVIAAIAVVIVVVIGAVRGLPLNSLFLLATTIAIAAIPTGLPTVVTTLLSIGTQQLAQHNAIVKHLASVETLGSTSAICSDKTGTLTLNKMTARVLIFGGNRYTVTGEGYDVNGRLQHVGGVGDIALDRILFPMALDSDAVVDNGSLVGDPTEGALVVLAAKGGLDVAETREQHPRIAEVPFDSAYKMMATFHRMTDDDGREVVRCYVKGAPDVLIARSANARWIDGNLVGIDVARERALAANAKLGEEGLRVLMLAEKDLEIDGFDPDGDLLGLLDDLTLLGMVGIVDPPRPEVPDAIASATAAGIRVRMITGDHVVTAAAIASEIGIDGEAISGADIDAMGDDEFAERVGDIGVFGRVSPQNKVSLVQALRSNGEIVAMTGDGVNDAPALKAADIGVAMGITGTEVSKQSAKMILTDDDFATIVKAIRLGRAIYDNLLKYLRFQLLNLIGYVVLFIGSSALNIAGGAPLTPLQVLWLNFAIAVPMAIGLGYDTPTPGLMDRAPRPRHQRILKPDVVAWMLFGGFVMGATTLFVLAFAPGDPLPGSASVAGTMGLVAFSLSLVVAALSSRSPTETVFSSDIYSNPRLIRALAISVTATVLATEFDFLQNWFTTVRLNVAQWGICVAAAAVLLAVLELYKMFLRSRRSV